MQVHHTVKPDGQVIPFDKHIKANTELQKRIHIQRRLIEQRQTREFIETIACFGLLGVTLLFMLLLPLLIKMIE